MLTVLLYDRKLYRLASAQFRGPPACGVGYGERLAEQGEIDLGCLPEDSLRCLLNRASAVRTV
jgi:hypothetical protein